MPPSKNQHEQISVLSVSYSPHIEPTNDAHQLQSTDMASPVAGSFSNNEQLCSEDSRIEKKRSNSVTKISVELPRRLIYSLTETPPIHLLILFAIQQACLAISTPLGTAAIIAQGVCAQDESEIKIKIVSSTMLMMGLATFCVSTFGVRLPIFQGPAPGYIIPLIILMSLPEFKCPDIFKDLDPETNETVNFALIDNGTIIRNADVATQRINAYAGSLMLAGSIHCLVGLTGLVGVIARFVGPITIVPVVTLFGIYIHTLVVSFAETNWIVATITAVCCIVLSMFLGNRQTPLPMWTPGGGFRIVWQPLHQMFALLFSVILGWTISYIMTEYGALSSDPNSKEFNARTDARHDDVIKTNWFLIPYPGQFGMPSFSSAALISFLVSTFLSILDSIGDYNASARMANVPLPPKYALNRGIAVEGLMSFLSGSLGCGHATASYGENIGAMGISRVASRSVFQVVGIMYILLAIMGKVGAFLITIPYAVIGGSQIITFGMLIGVILSYLDMIDLKSTRNMSILGIAILLGMMLPYWCQQNPEAIKTGNLDLDNVIVVLMSNPSFVGGLFACVMDNAVPGTQTERGITAQLEDLPGEDRQTDVSGDAYESGPDIYRLSWIPSSFRYSKLAKFLPIFDKS